MKFYKSVLSVLIIILFISAFSFNCQQPAAKSSDSSSSGSASVSNDLPVYTIYWVDDGTGFFEYYTNDSGFYNYNWYNEPNSSYLSSMTSVDIQVKKISGNSSMGYGIVFCYQNSNNMYRVSITTTGFYRLSKYVSGTWSYNYNDGSGWTTSSKSWPTSSNLLQGYGAVNDIQVTRAGSSFSIYFNGTVGVSTADMTFTDTAFTSGYCGGYVLVGTSAQESFPNTPVDFKYKIISKS
jgi:hypothetical protein